MVADLVKLARLQLIIDFKSCKALGLTISSVLLVTDDEVIE